MSRSIPLSPEALLAHAGFLQGLAERLVRDPAGADDLVQEAYTVALTRQPEERDGLRAWLATVVRHAARRLGRTQRRRAAREQRAVRPRSALPPEVVLEREEARQLLVAAVLRLPAEPRDAVLLRYYENLPPREVARRLGVPVETVRTRLRRALERLRDDLDRGSGGRRAWTAVLVPLLPSPGEATPWLVNAGGLLMGAKAAVMATVLLLVLAGGGAWLWTRAGSERERPPDERTSLAAPPHDPAPGLALAGRASAVGAQPPAPRDAGRGEGRPALPDRTTRARGIVRGRVLSGRTHAPLAHLPVRAWATQGVELPPLPDPSEGEPELREVRSDEDGSFVFAELPLGAYRVRVDHPEEGSAETGAVASDDPEWLTLYPLAQPVAMRSLFVQVHDAAGRAVEGADVRLAFEWDEHHGSVPAGTEASQRRLTDRGGAATFEDLPLDGGGSVRGVLSAEGPGGLARAPFEIHLRNARPRGAEVNLVLAEAGTLDVQVEAPAGVDRSAAGVAAVWFAGSAGQAAPALLVSRSLDPQGRARLEGLPAGDVFLWLQGGDLRVDLNGSSGAGDPASTASGGLPRVRIESGRTVLATLKLAAAGRLEGVVRRAADGVGVGGLRVELTLLPGDGVSGTGTSGEAALVGGAPRTYVGAARRLATSGMLTRLTGLTDAEGRYRFVGLFPGAYRVEVETNGALASHRIEPAQVRDGQTSTLEHVLEPAGSLELAGLRAFTLHGLRLAGQSGLARAFERVLEGPPEELGSVWVHGLPVGRYELVLASAAEWESAEPLARFEVRAGESTFVSAVDLGVAYESARVLLGGRGVAGVEVLLGEAFGTFARTASDGRFRRRLVGPTAHSAPYFQCGMRLPWPDAVGLQVRAARRTGQEVLLALPTADVRLLAVDSAGHPVPGADVALSANDGPPPVAREPNAQWTLASVARARAGPDGRARFVNVPPGAHRVAVTFPGSGVVVSAQVVVEHGAVDLRLEEPLSGSLSVRVEEPDGSPAAGVTVVAQARVDEPQGAGGAWSQLTAAGTSGRTAHDGSVRLHGLPAGPLRVLAFRLRDTPGLGAQATHNAAVEVAVAPGAEAEMVLRLTPVAGR